MTREVRHSQVELRAEGRRLFGTAIRYGDESRMLFGRERFEPGAFGDLAGADVILNASHRRDRPLARTGGGGLELADSPEALTFTAELPQTRDADDTLALVRGRVLRGASIEFLATRDRDESGVRVVEAATLTGIGIVDSPAYPDSAVAARHALDCAQPEIRIRPQGGLDLEIPLEVDLVASVVSATALFIEREALDDSIAAITAGAQGFTLLRGNDYNAPLASASSGDVRIARQGAAIRITAEKLLDAAAAREVVGMLRDGVELKAFPGVVGMEEEIEEFTGTDGRAWRRRRVKKGGICEGRISMASGGGFVKRRRRRRGRRSAPAFFA